MLYWNVFLYTSGAFLALRSLISLMAQHQQIYERTMRRQVLEETMRAANLANAEVDKQPSQSQRAEASAA